MNVMKIVIADQSVNPNVMLICGYLNKFIINPPLMMFGLWLPVYVKLEAECSEMGQLMTSDLPQMYCGQ